MYTNDYLWGMNSIWWIIWGSMLLWIFILPYNIPFQRYKKDTALDILLRRFSIGDITKEEYQEKKKILETDYVKQS